MMLSNETVEQQLLQSSAGRAVYDSLIQANIDPNSVSLELVKQMLLAEIKHRSRLQPEPRELMIC